MIEFRDVSFKIKDKVILNNISFSIKPGQLVGLLGTNGAGKSTIMKLLVGELHPTSGEIYFEGQPIKEIPLTELAQKRAYVSQKDYSSIAMTALDMVLLGRLPYCQGNYQESDYAIAYEILQQLSAAQLAGRFYNQLSGGERQLIQLARAIAQLYSDKLVGYLLLDEFSASMDLFHQHNSLNLLKKLVTLNSLGTFIIIHDLTAALNHLDYCLVLDQGHLAAAGVPKKVLNEPLIKEVFKLDSQFLISPCRELSAIVAL